MTKAESNQLNVVGEKLAVVTICTTCLFNENCPLIVKNHPYLEVESIEGDKVQFKCLCIVPIDWSVC